MRKILVRGFWGPRRQSAQDCAERWAACLARLQRAAPELFTTWHSPLDEDEKAPPALRPDAEGLLAEMARLNEYLEVELGATKAELGFTLSAWSTAPHEGSIVFRGTVGSHAEGSEVRNSITVTMQGEAVAAHGWEVAASLLAIVAEHWDIDWGDAGNAQLWARLKEHRSLRPSDLRAGYATYLSARRWAEAPALDEGTITSLDGGVLIDLRAEVTRASSDDPVVRLDQTLAASPAFTPVPDDRGTW
ncbi:Imm52 family immunity protein [Nonomuraea sp. NPDC005692]|uniref:Imm52 family immunity protein n=1 Tax=Nonomuraea sp. NPDC005692 TaxID=3157168 RepID=UPI0033DB44B2